MILEPIWKTINLINQPRIYAKLLLMFDLSSLVEGIGYIGIFAIIFAESGVFLGFFLPGDSLLFTAGILASQGVFNLIILATLTFLGAILGDNFGYAFGKKVGPSIFTKEESLLFKKSYITTTENFYKKHGGKTIILARFIPIVRTFAPILAGVGTMNYRVFFSYNIIGAALWAVGLTVSGYLLGNIIPSPDTYLLPIVAIIIIASIIPGLVHFLKVRNQKTTSKE